MAVSISTMLSSSVFKAAIIIIIIILIILNFGFNYFTTLYGLTLILCV